jgi:hypothetical protein
MNKNQHVTTRPRDETLPSVNPGDLLPFDYCSVSGPVANFLRGQADRIRRQAGTSIIQIGKALIAAKHYLSHGAFLKWLVSEVGMPARTAQDYMQVAHWAKGKSATVALLPASVLYVISSPRAPQRFVDDVLERIEHGQRVDPGTLRAELKALLENQRNDHAATTISCIAAHDSIVSTTSSDGLLFDFVAILERGLSDADFARVSRIMTSEGVLNHPRLADEIMLAFRIAKEADVRARVVAEIIDVSPRSAPEQVEVHAT